MLYRPKVAIAVSDPRVRGTREDWLGPKFEDDQPAPGISMELVHGKPLPCDEQTISSLEQVLSTIDLLVIAPRSGVIDALIGSPSPLPTEPEDVKSIRSLLDALTDQGKKQSLQHTWIALITPFESHLTDVHILRERGFDSVHLWMDFGRVWKTRLDFLIELFTEKCRRDYAVRKITVKDATVLFSDIQAYSARWLPLEPDKYIVMASQLDHLLTEITRIITHLHGHVDKFIGDAVMAVFIDEDKNSPPGEESHDVRSIWAALAIQDMVKRRTTGTRVDETVTEAEDEVKVNFGIASGWVWMGMFGPPEHCEYTVVGRTVNAAARVQSQAHDGAIIVDQSTLYETDRNNNVLLSKQRRARSLFAFSEPSPPTPIKNESYTYYHLVSGSPPPTTTEGVA